MAREDPVKIDGIVTRQFSKAIEGELLSQIGVNVVFDLFHDLPLFNLLSGR